MADAIFYPILPRDQLVEGGKKPVTIHGNNILICQDDGQIFAIENRCSHADQSLECGRMRWGWIACPAHGSRFDLATGEALNPPAPHSIRIFPVRIEEDMIEVAVDPS